MNKELGSEPRVVPSIDQTIASMPLPALNSPVDEQLHLLVGQSGPAQGLRLELGEKPLSLGRTAAADIQLADPQVSKKHCQLRLAQDRVHVADLGSTNGTLVDLLRVNGEMILPVGARLRLGSSVFLHELRSRRDLQKTKELESDLQQARAYVQALLPPPRTTGPERANWCYIPCSILGGDAFGYHDLDEHRLALYLIDVCGHGAGAAMHSVSAINVLRQQTLPGVDFLDPAAVLRGLNQAFDMDRHNGMYFTLWYGVYDRRLRQLTYSSAGHPPAWLVGPERRTVAPLQTRSMPIGTNPAQLYTSATCPVPSTAALYLFSDGVYEIVTKQGAEWTLEGFRDLVLQPPIANTDEAVRLQLAVEQLSATTELADDFSLVVVHFD